MQHGQPLRVAEFDALFAEAVQDAAGPARDDLGLGAVLVRPDGVVDWAGDRVPDREAFERAAGRWFGSPTAGQDSRKCSTASTRRL
ncbi:hypothetical protein ACIBO5_54125 [Nonomuraea angiospora]|uniref:aromatic-ring hydroxylase C-terminal domain-containing protein n=1 Tax=Nonomuraea angiospora TaxID=46172 RepID=UPI0029B9DB41|nr:hypothetical protein [Nonomuraea angiospora]MDX3109754.1 hypothetical protein [Nonomuraea angiospora]